MAKNTGTGYVYTTCPTCGRQTKVELILVAPKVDVVHVIPSSSPSDAQGTFPTVAL